MKIEHPEETLKVNEEKGIEEKITKETGKRDEESLRAFKRNLIRENMTDFDADYGNAGEALKIYLTEGIESGDFNKVEDLMKELRTAIDGIKLKYQKGIIENL
jgi:hypothetical protein